MHPVYVLLPSDGAKVSNDFSSVGRPQPTLLAHGCRYHVIAELPGSAKGHEGMRTAPFTIAIMAAPHGDTAPSESDATEDARKELLTQYFTKQQA